jgi:hypothetical protein
MNFDQVSTLAQQLEYRDKLRLAQLLIQLARKEEEEANPDKRASSAETTPSDPELIKYVSERLRKLKPTKKETVLNSIAAMFQFQGGISDADKEKLFAELQKGRHLSVSSNGRIDFPPTAA